MLLYVSGMGMQESQLFGETGQCFFFFVFLLTQSPAFKLLDRMQIAHPTRSSGAAL